VKVGEFFRWEEMCIFILVLVSLMKVSVMFHDALSCIFLAQSISLIIYYVFDREGPFFLIIFKGFLHVLETFFDHTSK
jgi:hypothetical protein